MKLLALDLEIAKEIPTVHINRAGKMVEVPDDFNNHRPLGITCAAIRGDGDHFTTVFAAHEDYDFMWSGSQAWADIDSRLYQTQMTREAARKIVAHLMEQVKGNLKTILTWNGQFDLHTLAEESGMWKECADLALNHHVDMMFEVFCGKGWPVSLKAALAGMGLEGKLEGMDGAKAPTVWKSDPLRVLQYVERDVAATMELANVIQAKGELTWQSASSGRWQQLSFPHGKLRTVRECLELPVKDNSWMDTPMTREGFFEWMGDMSPLA